MNTFQVSFEVTGEMTIEDFQPKRLAEAVFSTIVKKVKDKSLAVCEPKITLTIAR